VVFVVTSSWRRTWRGGTSDQSFTETRPWSGYGRVSPMALKITAAV